MVKLSGRVCMVTGGASGIGAAIVRRLIEEGAIVVIADIDMERACTFASTFEDQKRVSAVSLDVRDPPAFSAAVQSVAQIHGGLHALYNNAGVGGQSTLEDMTRDRFDAMMAINVFSVIAGTQAAAAVMRVRGGGRIINTCSVSGRRVYPGYTLYGATKYAVRALTLGFAQELATDGIRVNAICPGMVHTPLWDAFNEDGLSGSALVDTYARGAALGRAGQPDDIAGMASFLASDDASYITGQLFTVDGGLVFD